MKRLSLLLALTLLLGGCGYYVEVNEKSYVIALGVDKGKNDLIKVSFLFTSPDSGDEDGGGEKKKEKDIVTLEAPTVYSAIRLLDTFRSKRIDLTHTKLIVFSRELAEKGIEHYVTEFVNTRDFRPSVYLCVSEGKAEKFFHSIEPKQDLYIEKYIDRLFGKVTNNSVNEAYLYYDYFNSSPGWGGNILPLVGVAQKENMEAAETRFEYVIPDDFSANYTAREIPIDKEDAAVLCGYAVFDDKRMVGTLGLMESSLVRMLTKNLPNGQFSIYYPPNDSYYSVDLHQIYRSKINVTVGNPDIIDIRVRIMGEFTGVDSAFKSEEDYDKFLRYLDETFSAKMKALFDRTQKEFRSDVFNLGDYAKRSFLTIDDWKAYDWESRYTSAVIRPHVIVQINDYGELRDAPEEEG